MEHHESVWHTSLDRSGRVLLPVELRQEFNVKPGSLLVWIKRDSGVELKSFEESLAAIQAYYKGLAPADDLWSDAIVQQRREENAHD
jgi:bifunctional DNA-binding transcriptional regulator/antitoxin component of YhaV-PrlF toxin-antitoxin module